MRRNRHHQISRRRLWARDRRGAWPQDSPRTPALGPYWGWGLILLAWCLSWAALAPGVSWAGIIFTPNVTAGVGYDDNVRQQSHPNGDTFFTVRPGASLQAGKPTNQLTVAGSAEFNQYSRLTNYNGFQSGDIMARWRYLPSQLWAIELFNGYSSSYDLASLSETGSLAQVQQFSGRHDRNITGGRVTHLLGPGGSQLSAGYSYAVVNNENPQAENSAEQKADVGLSWRFAPKYRFDSIVTGTYTDYERSPDIEQATLDLRLARIFTPRDEIWLGVVTGTSHTLSDQVSLSTTRDYDSYTARAGFKKSFSPSFDAEGWVGATYISGDTATNQAAGEASPTGQLSLTYRQKIWLLRLTALESLDENQSPGQNTGLTDRKQLGLLYDISLTQRWRFNVGADWVRDDYKQNAFLVGRTFQGYSEYWRLYSVLSYQITQHWSVRLDYRYLTALYENDVDNIEQNRIVLLFDYSLPFRW